MTSDLDQETLLRNKINLETAKIPWLDLQRSFAGGRIMVVRADLDLVETAYQFTKDNSVLIQQWLEQQKISPASDEQAKCWIEINAVLWAVVVKPWVLIQEKK